MNRRPLPLRSGLSRRTALGRVAAIGAALGLGSRIDRAAAQDATPSAVMQHPLVGLWQNAVNGPDANERMLRHC